jgi:ribosomal small subunit protein bTHX
MGKGDKKSKRGKIIMGSYGISRKRKKSSGFAATPAKAANVATEEKAEKSVKKASPKAAAEKPAAEKKLAAKKAAKSKSE